MEHKLPSSLKDVDSLVSLLKYVLSFFIIMLLTYVTCITRENSVWFSLTAAIAAGILALIVCHAFFEGGQPRIRHYYIWMSALLSFCAIAICYTSLGVYPFGEKSVMIIDMHHQYSAFFSLIREKVLSFDSLSYSESVGMGGGLIPLIAYYLCSPYNLIALILPRDNLTEAIALIEVLKITTAGATFAIFCRGVFHKDDYGTVAVSVAYALSAYFIAYSWDVMWLDCLVLLPLIVYGLDKVIDGKSPLLYCITLGLAITTNYYIGYMICVFLVLWYLMRMIERSGRLRGLSRSEQAAAAGKNFLRFCWTSAVGGMLSMWILIPTAISLRETSGAEDEFARAVTGNFDFWDIFSRTLYGNTPTERGDNLPNIYCSMLAVLMVALFLACRKIPLRTRVCFGGLLGGLVVLLANNWTNFAFHGFHFPNDLPYRNSFLISFTMLAIAVQALDKIGDISRETLFKTFGIVAAMIVVEQKFGGNSDYTVIWYSLGLIVLYAFVLGISSLRGSMRNGAVLTVVLALAFTEMSGNAVSMIHTLNENEVFTERANFVSDYDVNKAAVSYVEGINTDGSRMEILPRKTCNDNALYDYSGLTVFASSNAKSTTTLMGKLGYAINGVNSYIYNSYVPLMDSVLNLKYVVFNHDIGSHAQLTLIDSVADAEGNYRYIYENTLALPRGFTVDNDIIYWNSNSTVKYENPFEVQNKFVEYAVNGAPVYRMLDLEAESMDNMNVEINGSYFYAETVGGSGSFTALHTTEASAQSYVYVDCRAAEHLNVSVGNSSWNVTPYEPYVIDLGKLAEGTEIRVTVESDTTCSGNIYIAAMDNTALNAAISSLGQNQWQLTEHRDGFLKGTISAAQDCVMFTSIPYNDGWTATVDGKQADIVAIGDALLGIYLPAGSHEVALRYHTGGFLLGVTMTLLGIILLVLWATRKKTVYPLLKEFVPVFYQTIGEVREPSPLPESDGAQAFPAPWHEESPFPDDDVPDEATEETASEVTEEAVSEVTEEPTPKVPAQPTQPAPAQPTRPMPVQPTNPAPAVEIPAQPVQELHEAPVDPDIFKPALKFDGGEIKPNAAPVPPAPPASNPPQPQVGEAFEITEANNTKK